MKALILAGGFGTRLKEVIHDRPKVMAEINGRPFLEYVLAVLRKNGIDEVVISVGFLGDFIKSHFSDGREFGLKIEYLEEKYPLGTGGAIREAQRFFQDTFLVVNGDTYLDTDLTKAISFHLAKEACATIVLVKRESTLETGSVLMERSGKITSFEEKSQKDKAGLVNSGHYIFEPEVFKFIEKDRRISLEKKIFPILAQRGLLYGFEVEEDFFDVGTPQRYRKAQELLSKKKRKIVEAQAPVRISFSGGGTDLPQYFLKNGGCVVSGTIDKYAHVRIKTEDTPLLRVRLMDYQKEENYPVGRSLPYDGSVFDLYKAVINRLGLNSGVEIRVWGDFPLSSGLGTSSAVAVALIGAILKLQGQKVDKGKVAQLAIEIEREILKIPGGWQDQYASSFGGLNFIEFLSKGKVRITPLRLRKKTLEALGDNLLLLFLATKRSEKFQQKYLAARIKEEGKIQETLDSLKGVATEIRDALCKGRMEKFGTLLHEAWMTKRRSSPGIATNLVDQIYKAAMKGGAQGGKLLGAGGGGCLLFWVPPFRREKLIKTLEKEGAQLLTFKFEFEGLTVDEYED